MYEITEQEHKKLNRIKKATLAGSFVTDADKQWVLDLAIRAQKAVSAEVARNAAERGFNVVGLVITD